MMTGRLMKTSMSRVALGAPLHASARPATGGGIARRRIDGVPPSPLAIVLARHPMVARAATEGAESPRILRLPHRTATIRVRREYSRLHGLTFRIWIPG